MTRYLLILIAFILLVGGASSCSYRSGPTSIYHRTFVIPEYKVRKHWGAPRRQSVEGRYWGRHRYGPRPHPYRGRFR